MDNYPNSPLRESMRFFLDEAKQDDYVEQKLSHVRGRNIDPESIRILEPCCGSGHVLVYLFDLLFLIYEEKGYMSRDIPTLILSKNLFGLEIDKRASQLASFSLVMRARSKNSRFFDEKYYVRPQIFEIYDSKPLVDMRYRQQMNETSLSAVEKEEIAKLVDVFVNAKDLGSLTIIHSLDFELLAKAYNVLDNDILTTFNIQLLREGKQLLRKLIAQAKVIAGKYDVCVTNPPYMGTKGMNPIISDFLKENYNDAKGDLFAAFIRRLDMFANNDGYYSLVTQRGWLYLSTFVELRNYIQESATGISFVELGAGSFEDLAGEVVQSVVFCMRKGKTDGYISIYKDLCDSDDKENDFSKTVNKTAKIDRFSEVPGMKYAMRLSDTAISAYQKGTLIEQYAQPKKGLISSDNNRFLRLWFEVQFDRIQFNLDLMSNQKSEKRWLPHNKGGSFRRWYGNQDYIRNWENNGKEVKAYAAELYGSYSRQIMNERYYLKESISWSSISSHKIGARYYPTGFIFDTAGPSMFIDDREIRYYIFGLLGCCVSEHYVKATNPTINLLASDIVNLPVLGIDDRLIRNKVDAIVEQNIQISKEDWNSFETSWDFSEHPFVKWSRDLWDVTSIGANMQYFYGYHPEVKGPLELCYMLWQGECDNRFKKLKKNEEELNHVFIDIFGLQDELIPEVADENITVRKAELQRDIRSFISYLVGIVMGRYSLDIPGLVYAGGAWDPSMYRTYQPDDDGIVPIYDGIGMEDGLTGRITNLIKQIFGEKTFRENMDFIAEGLGKTSNESSVETLNRYLNEGFYADHLKIYQKRPIYWMFSSGKNKGFKCLVYMHRYNKDTLARINAKYYLPESTRQKIELEDLDNLIKLSEGKERIRLEKSRTKFFDKYNETIEYGQVLDHMANKYIDINLDDGIKINYEKFQGVELVLDSGMKIKKDLLISLR